MSNKLYIDGPVNVVRLEGKVNNIKKVIYLFMDFHVSPNRQTECYDIRSKDIKNYFVDNFDKISKTDKIYDFLVEYFPTHLPPTQQWTVHTPFKDIYLTQIRKLFQSGINIKDDVVKESKKFKNVRFHYLDIRDYTKIYIKAKEQLDNYIHNIWRDGFYTGDDSLIKDTTNIITSQGKYLLDVFNISCQKKSVRKLRRSSVIPTIPKTAEALSKYTDKDTDKIVQRIVNKIKNIYHHQNIKEIINNYINNELRDAFCRFFDIANELNKFVIDNAKEINYPHNKLYNKKEEGANYGYPYNLHKSLVSDFFQLGLKYIKYWDNFQLHIMDAYFLRRFLDKDYITNAITYTGAAHSANYIYVLVKYFGFDITHFSYMKYDVKKTTDIIKKSNNSAEIQFLFFPDTLLQCSDLTEFPKLFT